MEKVTNEIFRLKVPFDTNYTSVFYVKTESGLLIFDAATYDSDVTDYIVPKIKELGYKTEDVKYIFISHDHADHSRGLKKLLEFCTNATVVAKSEELIEKFKGVSFVNPEDGFEITKELEVVEIPGHTLDSMALFDKRTNTLLTGDCLQLYGPFGSGDWGSNITYLKEHFEALSKLKKMDISLICASHNYHPMGNEYKGDKILKAYELCVKPLIEIKEFINENPCLDDSELAKLYNKREVPNVGPWVFKAVREYKGSFEIK